MKFTLEIDLGNDAMGNAWQVLNAINQSLDRMASHGVEFTEQDSSDIIDANGNTVGKWQVEADAKTDAELYGWQKTHCCLYHHTGGNKQSSCGGDVATNV